MRKPSALRRTGLAGLAALSVLTVSACSFAEDPSNEMRASASAERISGEKAAETATPTDDGKWKLVLNTDFSGDKLDAKWRGRIIGNYGAKGRNCAAPYDSNSTLSDGVVNLAVSQETEAANVAKAKAAGCKKDSVFRNAMISTENTFTMKSGKVAARIKFPRAQGMHGGVWLQSAQMAEIDVIESYGYGRGLTSVVHIDGERTPKAGKDTYVLQNEVKDPAWWGNYHEYSVEWNDQAVIFRVDGKETKRLKKSMPAVNYFLVLSNLNSDWEQFRLTKPTGAADVQPAQLPATMSVDWVKAWVPA